MGNGSTNPARGRYPAQAREGADYPSLNHSKVVMIGRPFAAPFLWIPAHSLPAAPNKAASSSP